MFLVRTGEGSLLSRQVKEALARQCKRYGGTPFELRFWDGGRLRIGGGAPAFAVTFKTRRALAETVLRGTLGLGESYVRHEVMFEGDLEDALTGLASFQLSLRSGAGERLAALQRGVSGLLSGIGRARRTLSAEGEKANVERLYGRGDELYLSYLDRQLQISCGYFRTPHDGLDDAQEQKIAYTLRKLALRRGQRLLDIGCGWGHLMLQAAETYGVQCLGITLCDNQARYIREQAEARRLPVEVRVMSYRDLDPYVTWDRVVSVGAMGHVGEHRMGDFFGKLRSMLAPGAVCLLDTVVATAGASDADPFLQKHIAPGCCFPTLESVTRRAAARGFHVLDAEDLRRHHALTAHHWRRNFLKNYESTKRATGLEDAFMRTWEFYLASTVAWFRVGRLSLIQMVISNGPHDDYLFTREPLIALDEGVSRDRAISMPGALAGFVSGRRGASASA